MNHLAVSPSQLHTPRTSPSTAFPSDTLLSGLSEPSADTCLLLNAFKRVQTAINDLSALYSTLVSSFQTLEKRLDALSASLPTLPPSTPLFRLSRDSALTSILRRRQVFLRVPDTEDMVDHDFLGVIRHLISFTHYMKHYRLPSKSPSPSPRPFILTFYSSEDAEMFINCLYKEKKKGHPVLSPLIARINYDREDVEEHSRLWKEAIQLNDQARSRVAIVRGLSLIRFSTPGEWTVQPREPQSLPPRPLSPPQPPLPPPSSLSTQTRNISKPRWATVPLAFHS